MSQDNIFHRIFSVSTRRREEMLDITEQVSDVFGAWGIRSGIGLVYVPHTTAGITINEHADPAVRRDILMTLEHLVPDSLPYRHAEGNSPAHVKASLMGSSVLVGIQAGRIQLGTWQGIFFCEFDGPRSRKVEVSLLPAAD